MSQPTMRKPYDPQVRYGRILGLLFAAVGFAVIGFGWNGAAREALLDKQFPYLISGGLGGLGLVVFGGVLLIVAQIRSERARLTGQLEELGSALSKVTTATSEASAGNGRVVAGRSTYHRPDCRLVEGKSDLDVVSVDAARGRGLSPCRVCGPEREDRPAPRRGSRSGRRPRKASARSK